MADTAWQPRGIEAAKWGGMVGGARVPRLYEQTVVRGVGGSPATPAALRRAGVAAATARPVLAAMTPGFWRPAVVAAGGAATVAAGERGDQRVARAVVVDGAVADVPTLVHVLVEAAQEGADTLVLASSSAADAVTMVAEAFDDGRVVAVTNSGPATAKELLRTLVVVAPNADKICPAEPAAAVPKPPAPVAVPPPIRRAQWAVVTDGTAYRAAHPQELAALNRAMVGVDKTGLVSGGPPPPTATGPKRVIGGPPADQRVRRAFEQRYGPIGLYGVDNDADIVWAPNVKEFKVAVQSAPEDSLFLKSKSVVVFAATGEYRVAKQDAANEGYALEMVSLAGMKVYVATKGGTRHDYVLRPVPAAPGELRIEPPGGNARIDPDRAGMVVWVDTATGQRQVVRAHARVVTAVGNGPGDTWYSGGADGTVAVWNKTVHVATLDARRANGPEWADEYGAVRSIAADRTGAVHVVHDTGVRRWRDYRVEQTVQDKNKQFRNVAGDGGTVYYAYDPGAPNGFDFEVRTNDALDTQNWVFSPETDEDFKFVAIAASGDAFAMAGNPTAGNQGLLFINGSEHDFRLERVHAVAVGGGVAAVLTGTQAAEGGQGLENPTQLVLFDTAAGQRPTQRGNPVAVDMANRGVAIVAGTAWCSGQTNSLIGVDVKTGATRMIQVGVMAGDVAAAGGDAIVVVPAVDD
jgi:hypothetical protein